jgi:hypothetical protein
MEKMKPNLLQHTGQKTGDVKQRGDRDGGRRREQVRKKLIHICIKKD